MDKFKKDRFSFLGLNFHNLDLNEAIGQVEYFIHARTPRMIFTPTAELIVRASENKGLREIYNSSDLLTIDSYVVYYMARLFGKQVKGPVSAARLMFDFLKKTYKKGYGLYLLGATEEIVNKTVSNLKKRYPGIKIVGWHNGYFDFENDDEIMKDIIEKKPDVLFVAMSSPLKENIINKNLKRINVPVCMGVGGSFDIIAGKCQLAPDWISKMALEWLYRLSQEPRRLWKRYLITNMRFVWLLLKEIDN